MRGWAYFACATVFLSCHVTSTFADQLILEKFDGYSIPENLKNPMTGPAPNNWEAPNNHEGVRDYAVVKESQEYFLRGHYLPGTSGKVIYRKSEWDLKKFPFISWRWRVNSFATGSSIHDKEDSSAAVYVTVKSGIKGYGIKYIWAFTDPIGDGYATSRWNPLGRLIATVIRTGGKAKEWVTEKRNFVEDFKKLYDKDPPGDLGRGIGVLTEGDATKTQPEADYDDFVVLSQ